MGNHPVLSGMTVGVMEISITFPLEFVKRQLQLQQQASALSRAAAVHFTGPLHCALHTLRTNGPTGLYCGFSSFIVFAGPKAAIKFSVFDGLMAFSRRNGHAQANPAMADTACGLVAGLSEAGLGQTPNQAISTKMLHDASPAGAQRFKSFPHAVRLIYAEHGFIGGFFCGLEPALIKGMATNSIRFPVFGGLKRLLQGGDGEDGAKGPLPPSQALLAGGTAGAISAVITQPIDTVMAQAQGLESKKFRGTLQCARDLVAAGGWRSLYFGLPTRCARVFLEMALQFALYEHVSAELDRRLG